jgi:hypothetical protein
LPQPPHRAGRWSLGVWTQWRGGAQRFDLATLGGSQAGARAMRRLDRHDRLHAVLRLSSSGSIGDGVEGAAGLSWRPFTHIPVALVVERREQIAGDGGRSAFAAFATGGVNDAPLGAVWRIDGYGAAGMVGAARRDLFAEGSMVLRRRVAAVGAVPIDAGIGGWAAVQPGVERIDIGPRISIRLPLGDVTPLLALDYRQRVAGNAAPDTGFALTLAGDF